MYSYNDPSKKFVFKALSRLPFMDGIEVAAKHQILYSMKLRTIEKGHKLFSTGEPIDTMRIIRDGQIEIYTYFDRKKFILDKL